MNKIKKAFDTIRAEDSLKQSTADFLRNERLKRKKSFKYVYRYAAACAAVLAVVFGIGGYGVLNTAVSYISIDVNPSVELALNRFDNVVEASAYNDDGAEALNGLDLKGKLYTEAIDILLSDSEFISALGENSRLNFTVVSDRQDEIIDGIQGCKGYGQYNGYCHGADGDLVSQAHCHGLSVGKYRAYTELSQYDETITAEDCRDMTMRQIYDMIREYSGEEYTEAEHHGYGKNRHHLEGGHHRNRK